jgi:hypothetical protein
VKLFDAAPTSPVDGNSLSHVYSLFKKESKNILVEEAFTKRRVT